MHITPEGSDSEPGYITRAGSPTESGTSPAFTTSPFDTSPLHNVTLFDPSTLADRLDIADLGQSFVNVPNPSDRTYPLRSAYWTPFNTMTTPTTTSTLQEPPVAPKPEGVPDGIPPAINAPPAAAPTTAQLIELLGHFVAQSANQLAHEPRTPEMPAKGHSAAPKSNDEPANLESYFTELEYQFNRCCITSTYNCKVQAMRYLDAAPHRVWRGTDAYGNDDRTWEDFKDKIYKLYPGSGSEQCINLSDILAFVDANAQVPYPNKKELGAYYHRLLSDTTMMIRGNRMTPREQSIIYLRGLPNLLQRQTTCRIGMKNLDRHPEDFPPIPELYDASAFCVLGGGMTMPISNTSAPTVPSIAQTLPYGGASLFGIMAPSAAPIVPSAPTIPSAAPQVQTPAPAPANQPLPFAP